MTFTLLLTCVGAELSHQVIQMCQQSRRHKIRIVGVDCNADTPSQYFSDVFYAVPPGTHPEYPGAIAEIAEKEDVNLVLPCSDEEAIALSSVRHIIERDNRFLACADAKIIKMVSNKLLCYEGLANLGLPVPAWKQANGKDSLLNADTSIMDEFGDAVVKPVAGSVGRNVFIISVKSNISPAVSPARETYINPAQLSQISATQFEGNWPCIVMPRLLEPVYDIDILGWKGRPVRVIPRRRNNSSLPNAGHELVNNDDLSQLGRQLIERLGLSWLYDCDVMYDQEGIPQVLEINPRPSGSFAVSICAGYPIIDDMISLALGQEPAALQQAKGKRVVPFKALAQFDIK